ncbi:unnamed protein product, partial [Staurois parvus]
VCQVAPYCLQLQQSNRCGSDSVGAAPISNVVHALLLARFTKTSVSEVLQITPEIGISPYFEIARLHSKSHDFTVRLDVTRGVILT